MDKLGIDAGTIIFQIINFGILIFLLNKFLYKPALKAISERKQQEKELEEGRANLEQLKAAAVAEQHKTLELGKKEQDEMLEEERQQIEKHRKKIISEAEVEANELVKQARAEMEDEKKELFREYEKDVQRTALRIAESVVKELLNESAKKKSIEEAIKKIGTR